MLQDDITCYSRRDPSEEGDQGLSEEEFKTLVRQLLEQFNLLRWTWLKEEGEKSHID